MGSWNTRVGGNLMHFGAVGWQPTALKSNHGVFKTPGFGANLRHFKCCRLPTYSPKVPMPQVPSKPSVFQDPMVAFKCCRLPTYSPKMHQVPSNTRCFKTPWVAFKCCRLPTYSPKMQLKFPPNPRVSRPWLLLSAVGCQPTAPKCLNHGVLKHQGWRDTWGIVGL